MLPEEQTNSEIFSNGLDPYKIARFLQTEPPETEIGTYNGIGLATTYYVTVNNPFFRSAYSLHLFPQNGILSLTAENVPNLSGQFLHMFSQIYPGLDPIPTVRSIHFDKIDDIKYKTYKGLITDPEDIPRKALTEMIVTRKAPGLVIELHALSDASFFLTTNPR